LHSESTEKALLGALLNKPENIDLVKRWIEEPDVFYFDFHKKIWETMIKLDDNGDPIDAVSVAHNFPQKGHIYNNLNFEIVSISTNEATPSRAEEYAKMLHEHWIRRRLKESSQSITSLTEDNTRDIDLMLNDFHNLVGDLISLKPTEGFSIEDTLQETHESIFNKKGMVRTGINKLDSVIHGMTRGEINIVAGRPSHGKTTIAANIARNLVQKGLKVAMFNREMPNVEMMKKFIAMESDTLSYSGLRHGVSCDTDNVNATMDYISENYSGKLFMYDDIRTLPDTFHEIRKIKPDVVIDDHIGLIEYPFNDRRDLRHKIGETTKQYKWLAKGSDICVILVSQLNRNIEHRIDAVPRLSDLAESGNLEQDAAIVAFTYYPYISRYGEPDSNNRIWTKNEIQLVVSKNRYGNTGVVEVGYSGDSCKVFDDLKLAESHERRKSEVIRERIE
jgi:replicative DNA helicase